MGSTITEKILSHASKQDDIAPGDYVVADVDYVMTHDSTGPLAIKTTGSHGRDSNSSFFHLKSPPYFMKRGFAALKNVISYGYRVKIKP